MPYVRVEPDLRLEHNGVEIFPLYEGDQESEYWFTLDPNNCDDFFGHGRNGQFDARRLSARWEDTPNAAQWQAFWKERFTREEDAIDALIRQSIESGSLREMIAARAAPDLSPEQRHALVTEQFRAALRHETSK